MVDDYMFHGGDIITFTYSFKCAKCSNFEVIEVKRSIIVIEGQVPTVELKVFGPRMCSDCLEEEISDLTSPQACKALHISRNKNKSGFIHYYCKYKKALFCVEFGIHSFPISINEELICGECDSGYPEALYFGDIDEIKIAKV